MVIKLQWSLEDRLFDRLVILTPEGGVPAEEYIKQDAAGPDIDFRAKLALLKLRGLKVGMIDVCPEVRVEAATGAEVDEDGEAVLRAAIEHDVLWTNVSVDDVIEVAVVKRI